MIVPMKKTTLLLSAKDKKAALQTLRKMGVLHVQHIQSPSSEEIDTLTKEQVSTVKALQVLEGIESKESKTSDNVSQLVDSILHTDEKRRESRLLLEEKQASLDWFQAWGKISAASVEVLKENGIYVRFYETDKAALKKLNLDKAHVVEETSQGVHLAYFGESEEDALDDLKEVRPPQVEFDALKSEIAALEKETADIDKEIQAFSSYTAALNDHLSNLEKHLEFNHVLYGMGDETQFVYLQGFCPEDVINELKTTSENEGWAYMITEPDDPTEVPTVIRSPKPLRIIQPLFKFMDVLPGYNEVDVSLIFLIFFSIFYAMIIGDAGYGLVFLAGTIFARIKAPKNAPSEPFMLFFVLSISTIIWGTLTGTWFGSKALAEVPFLNRLIIEPMYSFNNSVESTRFMMRFAFVLGLIHLVIGRILAFLKMLPSIKSIAQLGWAMIVVGIFFVADLLVLSNPLPAFVGPLMIAGLCVVGVFTNFQKNPLKLILSFISTVLNSLLDVISSFSDVVSYIRLFAVGIASVTVAASFNDMAGGIMAPLVLILGHGLNIVLGLMSVMVHGVRLNMLEFSGHLGQEWTGKEYKPFKE